MRLLASVEVDPAAVNEFLTFLHNYASSEALPLGLKDMINCFHGGFDFLFEGSIILSIARSVLHGVHATVGKIRNARGILLKHQSANYEDLLSRYEKEGIAL